MNALITKEYQGTPFVFREDGYFNMTKAAQAFGKFLPDFLRSTSVIEYMDALSKTGKFPDLIESRRGNGGGTWAHPKLAVRFAQWLDVRFAVWCDAIIEDILTKKADLTITKPEESATVAATQAGMGLDLAATLAQSILAAVSSVKQIENRVETLEKNVDFSSELVTYEADWLCDTCELSVDRRY